MLGEELEDPSRVLLVRLLETAFAFRCREEQATRTTGERGGGRLGCDRLRRSMRVDRAGSEEGCERVEEAVEEMIRLLGELDGGLRDLVDGVDL